MKEKLKKIRDLPKSERGSAVSKLESEDLKAFCEELIEQAKIEELTLGINGLLIKKEGHEVRAATAILNQFPEVELDEPSSYQKFDNQAEKLDAIIEDINNGRFPLSRAHELIHENYFEHDYGVKKYHTFLSYAAGKIETKKIREICKKLRNLLGIEQFCKYVELEISNGLMSGNVFALYLDKNGSNNERERNELSEASVNFLKVLKQGVHAFRNSGIVQQGEVQDNADTHVASNHKSADESHVAAFKMMVEGANLDVKAEYVKPAKEGDRPKEVIITDKGKLDDFVKQKLSELQNEVNAVAGGADEYIYNKYLRYNDIKKFISIEYKDLISLDKASFDKKIKGFSFQAKAAKRYLDDMVNYHQCGPYMPYKTNIPSTCGLTIEQIIAAEYFACDDKKNFELNNGVELEHMSTLNRILLIAQIYDIKRGINIDIGQDKPEEFEFQISSDGDKNRCLGGGINSLAGALKANHKAYEINTITKADIEREVKNIYTKIIYENFESLKDPKHTESLIKWNITRSISGSIKDMIANVFNEKYLVEFVENFEGYVPEDTFNGIIENGFNNFEVPASLNSVNNPADLKTETLFEMIMEEKLPLLVWDKEQGHISTLRYLLEKHGKKNIAEEIIGRLGFEEVRNEETQNAINYLCKSELNEYIGSRVLFRYKNHELTINDLKAFSITSIKTLARDEQINLIELAERGDAGLLRFCLENELVSKEDLKATDELKQTPMHWAAYYDNKEVVQEILKHKEGRKTLLTIDKSGETPLHYAAIKGNKDVVAEILKHNGGQKTLSIIDANGLVPIHWAVQNGKNEAVQEILKHEEGRKALLMIDKEGRTPLHYAAIKGNKDIVAEILKHKEGRSSLLEKDEKGLAPIHWAAYYGHNDVIAEILRYEEDKKSLSTIDENGRTPLHYAVIKGNKDVVAEILKHEEGRKALLITDKGGQTPLHYAAYYEITEVVQEILKHEEGKKTLSSIDMYGDTPLHLVAEVGNKAIIQEILKHEKGQNALSITDEGGRTPTHWAAYYDNKEVVHEILKHKKGRKALSMTDEGGRTPMHWAVYYNNIEVVQEILNHKKGKIALSIVDKNGLTQLHYAAIKGHKDIIAEILKHEEGKKTLSSTNKNGRTPMHCAALYDRIEVAKILIENGADFEIKDKNNKTPLQLSCEMGHLDVAMELLRVIKKYPSENAAINLLFDLLDYDVEISRLNEYIEQHVEDAKKINPARNSQTLLHKVAHIGRPLELIPFLIGNIGLNVDHLDNKFKTPLSYAIDAGHLEAVEWLINCGSDVNKSFNNVENCKLENVLIGEANEDEYIKVKRVEIVKKIISKMDQKTLQVQKINGESAIKWLEQQNIKKTHVERVTSGNEPDGVEKKSLVKNIITKFKGKKHVERVKADAHASQLSL